MTQRFTSQKLVKAIVAASILGFAAPLAVSDEVSIMGGLLKVTDASEKESKVHPLPAKFMITTRKDWGAFSVTNITTNETFSMPIFPHYPVQEGVQPVLLNSIENDYRTYIVPIDLTGRGLSDIIIGREKWGGWRVFTNGQALSKPFNGFVEGFFPKGQETVQSQLLNMDLTDLVVDNNLLGAVGDFLGNGTEQLAYFRPGWDAFWVVGAHGKVRFEADLRGIPTDKEGDRLHFLFPFKGDKPGERTRIAYHRKGVPRMLVFTSDGARFQRSEVDAKANWNLLNQYNPNPL
jgi:hypothetical protein